ncbi:hypothetical protein DPMN_171674 [Dreissena polymorpha]|uniref:Uncharacterized protein n=1 Tax=Dreissena polymorpha TaxID=45954 RepID=A0A9D4IED5_DREPO|nr:hypothetical protein DPMN_171674 [Dreissena polymorpha]
MDDCVERTVREKIKRVFKSDNIEEHMEIIKKCLEKADLITVFELDSKAHLASTMLQALLKGIVLVNY